MKFWGAGTAVFGADAMTLGIIDTDATWAQGALPLLGVWMGNQMGLGALPIEDVKSLGFALQGPTLAAFLDAVSVGATLTTGKQYNFDIPSLASGKVGGTDPIDWEATLSRTVRLAPAGTQLNRLRQALLISRQEDEEFVRRPLTLREATGAKPMTDLSPQKRPMLPGLVTPPREAEVGRTILGIQTPESAIERRAGQDITRIKAENAAAIRRVAELIISGNDEEAMDLMDKLEVPATSTAMSAAIKRAILERELREWKQAPARIKGKVAETQEQAQERKEAVESLQRYIDTYLKEE
jgi:hypothetical protein